jgi:glucose-1-phosphate thymidylyltransferase
MEQPKSLKAKKRAFWSRISNHFVGILPAAGSGTRLHPFKYPKELLPVAYEGGDGERVQPILSVEYSLRAMSVSGIRRCYLVISPWKTEIFRVLGDSSSGVRLSYLCQEPLGGTAHAVNTASPWLRDDYVCLSLPDTIFYPTDALLQICKRLISEKVDLVLGVFPVSDPTQLGPVAFDRTGRVSAVFDKPASTDLTNTWGIAAWSPRFTTFLVEHTVLDRGHNKPLEVGTIFNEAVLGDLRVKASYFAGGHFTDLGTPHTLGNLLLKTSTETRLVNKRIG